MIFQHPHHCFKCRNVHNNSLFLVILVNILQILFFYLKHLHPPYLL
nr:hypothetical protein GZ27A8_7 [uncultured archaeon GZfos27A8]